MLNLDEKIALPVRVVLVNELYLSLQTLYPNCLILQVRYKL